ncbi:hypothetical protein L218DRAFT_1052217 [Marasmius fiardii PR-910]|nr:hypothetical protein L218DRAFT_1052217 [Marasmius fiardii PR-910]
MYYIENQLQSVRNGVDNADAPELMEALSTLLDNPDFCPQGGLLGFPLRVSYRVYPGAPQRLDSVLDWLEGGDDVVSLVCNDLGLGLSIKAVLHESLSSDFWHKSWSGGRLLIDSAIDMDGHLYPENGLLQHWLDNQAREDIETQLVHPYDGSPCYRCSRYGERSKAIAWVGSLDDSQTGYTQEWRGYFAGEVERDRSNWEAYEAEEWRDEDD